tara:strand:+ start:672 stop:833 length:162 start_codon:yes stop_codon:yes gene_type:complete
MDDYFGYGISEGEKQLQMEMEALLLAQDKEILELEKRIKEMEGVIKRLKNGKS